MSDAGDRIGRFVKAHREVVILSVIGALCAVFYLLQPSKDDLFMTVGNWRQIAISVSADALMVVGMTLVIIAGGFDLSVGSTLAFGGIVSCKLMVGGFPIPVALVVGLAAGAMVGAANGFIVTKVGVNPLITTLGTMTIVRGVCLVITQAQPVSHLPAAFTALGGSLQLGPQVSQGPGGTEVVSYAVNIPWCVLIMVAVVVVADLLLRHSRFLRQVYYVGGNEEAARFSGIAVDGVRSFTYMATGMLAAAAGIVTSARLTSVSANFGTGAELRVISAVVIGGASLGGGEGTILGAFLGLLLVGVVQNGMEMLRVNIYVRNIVIGSILILAVTIDRIDREKIKRMIRWFRS